MPFCHLISTIDTDEPCEYGCGLKALYAVVVSHKKQLPDNYTGKIRKCCSKHYNSCPTKKGKQSLKMQGAGNSMFGRQHKSESIEKMRGPRPCAQGANHHFYGKTFKHIEAIKKLISIASAKSTHVVWKKTFSGRVYGMFFRSSFELFFIIQNYPNIRSNEGPDALLINYTGHRHYKPDFFIEDTLIEVKPKYATKDAIVQAKELAGRQWCEQNNHKYKIVTEDDITFDFDKAEELIASGDLIFNGNGLERFRERRAEYEKRFIRRTDAQ